MIMPFIAMGSMCRAVNSDEKCINAWKYKATKKKVIGGKARKPRSRNAINCGISAVRPCQIG